MKRPHSVISTGGGAPVPVLAVRGAPRIVLVVRTRLRLGHPSGVTTTNYKVWIPTEASGRLTISVLDGHGAPALGYVGTITVGGAAHVNQTQMHHAVAANQQGWLNVTCTTAAELQADFLQAGQARVAAAPNANPLVPWPFWYWPFGGTVPTGPLVNTNVAGVEPRTVFDKYARWNGSTSSAAGDWEDTHHRRPGARSWEGHCHAAANASAYFEDPAQVTVPLPAHVAQALQVGPNVTFDPWELKLLATEYYNNFFVEHTAWELHGDPLVNYRINTTRAGDGSPEFFYLLGYLTPHDAQQMDIRQRLIDHMRASNQVVGSCQGAQHVPAHADWFYANHHTFPGAVEEAFGYAAAGFYETLITRLHVEGRPLISNIRSFAADDSPDSTWNQAIYRYEARFVETNENDPHRMRITCLVRSNADDYDGSAPPLRFRHVWRLVFANDGTIDRANVRNRWEACERHDGNAYVEVMAPTDLSYMDPCGQARYADPNNLHVNEGNPHVGHELLELLGVHERFRSPLHSFGVAPAGATHGAFSVQTNTAFQVVVRALDANGHVLGQETGNVTVSWVDAFGTVSGAVTHAYQANDHGSHAFAVTAPGVAGNYTLRAAKAGVSTGVAVTVTLAAAAVRLEVQVPAAVAPNTNFNVTVRALDVAGNAVPGYAGTVQLALDAGGGFNAMGGPHTFGPLDNGAHVFTLQVAAVGGPYRVRASDGQLTTTSTPLDGVGPLASYRVTAPRALFGQTSFRLTITAQDAAGHVVAGHVGNVALESSTDGANYNPAANLTFQVGDHGVLSGPDMSVSPVPQVWFRVSDLGGNLGTIGPLAVEAQTLVVVARSIPGPNIRIRLRVHDGAGVSLQGYEGTVSCHLRLAAGGPTTLLVNQDMTGQDGFLQFDQDPGVVAHGSYVVIADDGDVNAMSRPFDL